MSTAWRYRLFRIGKMPYEFRAVATGSDVLVAAEGLSIKSSARAIRMPRARISRSVRLLAGSVVVKHDRILASVGKHTVLDTGYNDGGRDGQTLTFAEDGMHIHIEVSSVFPDSSGTVELHFRLPLEATLLAQLPSASVPVALADGVPTRLRRWI